MAVSLTHRLEKSFDVARQFLITDTVITATDIDQAVFLFDVGTQAYSRVATAADMQLYPNTRAAAITAQLPFYRTVQLSKGFSSAALANEFVSTLAERLKLLCVDYQVVLDDYAASTTQTVTS